MKLRIDPTQIRFRISEQEAKHLLNDLQLSEILCLPSGQKIQYLIKLSEENKALDLNYIEQTFILTLSKEQLKLLIKNPNKKGISGSFLEVDKNILFSLEIELPLSMCEH